MPSHWLQTKDKAKAIEDEVRLREAGWETTIPGGDREGRIIPTTMAQKRAAFELQKREVERQSGRNVSPTGVRDRPGTR